METEESGAFGEATDILSSETTGQPAPEIVTDSETEGGDSEFQDNEDDFIRATNEEIRQVEARLATLFGDVPPPVEAAETTEVVLPRKVHPNQLKLELGLSTSMVQITAKSVAGTEQYSDEELDAAAEEFLSDHVRYHIREIKRFPVLPVTEQFQAALNLRAAKEARDSQMQRELTEKLFNHNQRLIVFIAKRYMGRGLDFMDLVQEGTFGLMAAIRKFDPDRGVPFANYAGTWIAAAMQRAIENQGKLLRTPSHWIDEIRKMKKTESELREELGQNPTIAQLAVVMDVTEERIRELKQHDQKPGSLNKVINSDSKNAKELGDLLKDENRKTVEQEATIMGTKAALRSLLDKLPNERYRKVLRARYGLDDGVQRTFREIAPDFGVSSQKVVQIEQKAMKALRGLILKDPEVASTWAKLAEDMEAAEID